jgi:hypothetical protein
MSLVSRLSEPMKLAIRTTCQSRLETMRGYRLPWWAHWSQLAEVYLPRRYRFFVSPNDYNRGRPINATIVDETGVLAARTCATGMLAGLTSPDKPWFNLGIHGIDTIPEGEAKNWLAESTRRMLAVLGGSNFYTALGQSHHDNCVFGSAALIEYEDVEDVVRFYNPCLGEFFFGLDGRLTVNTLYREFTYTISEAVSAFGLENVSPSTQEMFKSASSKDTEVVIGHAIEPNEMVYFSGEAVGYAVPKTFKYKEVFWESTSSSGQKSSYITKVAGFHEKPFFGLRWDVTSNDPYGRSPGMDGLPASRQLQIEQRRKAEAIEKMVRPPMVGSMSMKNEPQDSLPGGITYVPTLNGEGFKPAYQVDPRISEMMEDIKEVQGRLKEVFFVPLFMAISNLETVRTATEIDARRAEQIIQLGPVLERIETEVLDKVIQRTFAIMLRRKLFDPPPKELGGATISVKYVSMLAEASRASTTTVIERFVAFVGGLAATQPEVMDNVDTDRMIEIYADRTTVPPDMIRPIAQVVAIRKQREAAQQQAAALQTGSAMAQGAQTLSKTDVGGGRNALQQMVGGAGGQ